MGTSLYHIKDVAIKSEHLSNDVRGIIEDIGHTFLRVLKLFLGSYLNSVLLLLFL